MMLKRSCMQLLGSKNIDLIIMILSSCKYFVHLKSLSKHYGFFSAYQLTQVYSSAWKLAKARGENPKLAAADARLKFLGVTWHKCTNAAHLKFVH